MAVKLLPPAFAADPERLQRFELEARAAEALSHTNLLAVFDISLHDGGPCVVFGLLQGATLRVQIAHGLAAAHQEGIVHRGPAPSGATISCGPILLPGASMSLSLDDRSDYTIRPPPPVRAPFVAGLK